MISIAIDTSSISETYFLSDGQVRDLVDYTAKEIAARFASAWEKEAINGLASSRQEYVRNIVVTDEGFGQASVKLVGSLPNMIESGASGFDIKEGILNGLNAKTGKNGNRYNTVPFSFGTPNSLAENFSGGTLPQEVYDIIKTRGNNEPLDNYDLKDLPKEYKEPKVKSFESPKSKSFETYEHKSSIYKGLSKSKDSTTGQNKYQSFRRISDNSAPNSWQHPGIEAHKFADKALASFNIPQESGRILDAWLDSFLG